MIIFYFNEFQSTRYLLVHCQHEQQLNTIFGMTGKIAHPHKHTHTHTHIHTHHTPQHTHIHIYTHTHTHTHTPVDLF